MKRKITLLSSLICISATGFASAAVIASWDDWADPTYNADSSANGIGANITATSNTGSSLIRQLDTAAGSTDGTFGTSLSGASTTTVSLQFNQNRFLSNDSLYINITNNTGSSLALNDFLFDYNDSRSLDTFSLDFENITQSTTTAIVASQYISGEVWNSFDIDVSSVTLADGDTGRFVMLWTMTDGGSRTTANFDNLAITTIPEPDAMVFAGIAGVMLLMIRRRPDCGVHAIG